MFAVVRCYLDIFSSAWSNFYDYYLFTRKPVTLARRLKNSRYFLLPRRRQEILSAIRPFDWPTLPSLTTVTCKSPSNLLLKELPPIAPRLMSAYLEDVDRAYATA